MWCKVCLGPFIYNYLWRHLCDLQSLVPFLSNSYEWTKSAQVWATCSNLDLVRGSAEGAV